MKNHLLPRQKALKNRRCLWILLTIVAAFFFGIMVKVKVLGL